MKNNILLIGALTGIVSACNTGETSKENTVVVEPKYITEQVRFDTDDPAIWLNKADLSKSFIIGTDKDKDGALYAFDLQGKILSDKVIDSLQRPNNTDILFGLPVGDTVMDVAVVAERLTSKVRIYRLPDMVAVDNGGIEAFVGETGSEFRDLMGITSYASPVSGRFYTIVGRKNGPTDGSYLWQYELKADSTGLVSAELVRKFGAYSGAKEIEALAVDQELGFVYYCDENQGVRKYYADPEKGNEEIAHFGQDRFKEDNEGIAIYKTGEKTGIIFISDQQRGQLAAFTREGSAEDPNTPQFIGYVKYKAVETDGIEIVNTPLSADFPKGLLVAMSEGKVFHLYSMEDILNALGK